MATVLTGQDSVNPDGMTAGQDVYAGYGGQSAFANMPAIMARFPGKKYLVFDTHVSHVDAFDVEPGGGSASDAPAFFNQWTQVNLNKPAFYASLSNIGTVTSALSGAGIARSQYYLIVAEWNNDPSIPSGYDGHQYASNSNFDSDSFYDYMWGAVNVPGVPPNIAIAPQTTDFLITWTAISNPDANSVAGEYEAQVELDKGGGTWELIRTVTTTGTSADIPGIDVNRNLRYRVSGGTWSDWFTFSS